MVWCFFNLASRSVDSEYHLLQDIPIFSRLMISQFITQRRLAGDPSKRDSAGGLTMTSATPISGPGWCFEMTGTKPIIVVV